MAETGYIRRDTSDAVTVKERETLTYLQVGEFKHLRKRSKLFFRASDLVASKLKLNDGHVVIASNAKPCANASACAPIEVT